MLSRHRVDSHSRPKADYIRNAGTGKKKPAPNGEGGLGSILGLLQGTSVCDPFALGWYWLFYEVDDTLPDVQDGISKTLRSSSPYYIQG